MAKFLNRELTFGTYFLGEYTEITGKPFQEALGDIDKNPFKYIPLFLQTAINTSAELDGLEPVTLKEVITEVDNLGIGSKEIQDVLMAFVKSLESKIPAEGKKKNPAKK
jgi:hypothetical protein